MREVAPSRAVGAVILSHCAPSTLGEKGTPTIPVTFFGFDHRQASAFAGVVDAHLEILGVASWRIVAPASWERTAGNFEDVAFRERCVSVGLGELVRCESFPIQDCLCRCHYLVGFEAKLLLQLFKRR